MDTLFDLVPYIIVSVIAYQAGKHVAMFLMSQNFANDPDSMIDMLKQIKDINNAIDHYGMAEDASPMQVERVGDQVYAYDTHSGEFLAQATSLELLLNAVNQRFPNKKFFGTISADNPAKELAK